MLRLLHRRDNAWTLASRLGCGARRARGLPAVALAAPACVVASPAGDSPGIQMAARVARNSQVPAARSACARCRQGPMMPAAACRRGGSSGARDRHGPGPGHCVGATGGASESESACALPVPVRGPGGQRPCLEAGHKAHPVPLAAWPARDTAPSHSGTEASDSEAPGGDQPRSHTITQTHGHTDTHTLSRQPLGGVASLGTRSKVDCVCVWRRRAESRRTKAAATRSTTLYCRGAHVAPEARGREHTTKLLEAPSGFLIYRAP
jgi:hypothetical protein